MTASLLARSPCHTCPASRSCLSSGLCDADMRQWSAALIPYLPAPTGKALYATGTSADAIYLMRTGCIKTFTVDADGQERVRGFYFPGDAIGLNALGISHYPESAVTVIPSQVCRVSKGQLHALLGDNRRLGQKLLERIAAELRQSLALSGDYSADQRVAAFILLMQDRLMAGTSLRLPMSRRDIANYLRLATETVSRALTRFQDRGWITSADKTLTLHDAMALWELAESTGICRPRLSLVACVAIESSLSEGSI